MNFAEVFLLCVAVVFGIVLLRSITVVRASHVAVVERLGRFSHTVGPGLHLLVPILDNVRARVWTAEQSVSLSDEPLVAADDQLVQADVLLIFVVEDPVRATYEVADLAVALTDALRAYLRERIGTIESADAVERGETRILDARMHLEPLAREWGVRVLSVDGAISRNAATADGSRSSSTQPLLTFEPQPVITKDDVMVYVGSTLMYDILDAETAYGHGDRLLILIDQQVMCAIRNVLGRMPLEQARASKRDVEARVADQLPDLLMPLGVRPGTFGLGTIMTSRDGLG